MTQKRIVSISNGAPSWITQWTVPLTLLGWFGVLAVTVYLVSYIIHPLLLLLSAAFLAYTLYPVVQYVRRYLPRGVAIAVSYLVFMTVIGVSLTVLIATATTQITHLVPTIKDILSPQAIDINSPLVHTLSSFGITHAQIIQGTEQLITYLKQFTHDIVPFLKYIFTSLFDFVIVLALSIYIVIDGEKFIAFIKRAAPRSVVPHLLVSMATLEQIVGGYIRGQLILAVLIGVLVGVGMLLFGVPDAVLLGVLAFLFAFIPIIGTIASATLCVLLALTHGWVIAGGVVIYFIVIHVLEGDIIGPRIVGKAVGLHPLVSIMALIIGSDLYGIVGALIASPVAGIIQSILSALYIQWRTTHPEKFVTTRLM